MTQNGIIIESLDQDIRRKQLSDREPENEITRSYDKSYRHN